MPLRLLRLTDPDEAQAVRNYYASSQFYITGKLAEYKSLGSEAYKGQPVRLHLKIEKIKGIEKSSGSEMETETVLKYWFGSDLIILRSETVSTGRVGDDPYYLRIIGEWELDPSIVITAPAIVPLERTIRRGTNAGGNAS